MMVLFYPGCGSDLSVPLVMLSPDRLIFMDILRFEDVAETIIKDGERVGARDFKVGEGRISFSFKKSKKHLIYIEGDVGDQKMIERLPGYDVYFEKKLPEILPSKTYLILYEKLRVGGYVIQDVPLLWGIKPELLGFKRIRVEWNGRFGLSANGPYAYRKGRDFDRKRAQFLINYAP